MKSAGYSILKKNLLEDSGKNVLSGKILFWLMLFTGLTLVLATFNAGGFSIWLLVSFSLWFAYLFNIKKSLSMGTFGLIKMVLFGAMIILLSILIVNAAPSGSL